MNIHTQQGLDRWRGGGANVAKKTKKQQQQKNIDDLISYKVFDGLLLGIVIKDHNSQFLK